MILALSLLRGLSAVGVCVCVCVWGASRTLSAVEGMQMDAAAVTASFDTVRAVLLES